jgi:uncharacterized protein
MNSTLDLADYRRRVSDLYAAVRRSPDPALAWSEWRVGRDALFGTHPQSPLPPEAKEAFVGSSFFDYDPAWRVVADVGTVDATPAVIGHSGEGTTRFARFGVARATLLGEPLDLDLYWLDSYGGGVFLPFRDATNGAETYGGGRYLLDTAKGADLGGDGEKLVLDFNFAYHPSCVWDDRWSCPLPPPGNRVDVAVRAGERLP